MKKDATTKYALY